MTTTFKLTFQGIAKLLDPPSRGLTRRGGQAIPFFYCMYYTAD